MSRIFLSAPDMSGRERAMVEEVFDSNYIAPVGTMLTRFEQNICAYTGIAHGVALSSGTAGLHLALRIAGVKAGDEVWTSSFTFIGGVAPIVYLNAKPVFFDLSPASWTLDCDLLEAALDEAAAANALPAAIMPTDIYGQSCDLDRILSLAKRHDIPVIVDSAEALGSFYKSGVHAGKGALMAVLSFNGNKMITTSGGGMLLSDDPALIEKARHLSTQAREPVDHYEHVEVGYNYRMSNVCAAIGVGQLEQIEQKVAKRRAIFERYVEAFADIEAVRSMPEPEGQRSTRWLTCITIDANNSVSAKNVQDACAAQEIEVRPLWKSMHMQPVFSEMRFVGSGICEHLFSHGLCLPSGSGMTDAEQERVIETIRGTLLNTSVG